MSNIPDDPDLAIAAKMRLCNELLEPLHATFRHVSIRWAFRSIEVNKLGNERDEEGQERLRLHAAQPRAPALGLPGKA